jgi:hypothetical protein
MSLTFFDVKQFEKYIMAYTRGQRRKLNDILPSSKGEVIDGERMLISITSVNGRTKLFRQKLKKTSKSKKQRAAKPVLAPENSFGYSSNSSDSRTSFNPVSTPDPIAGVANKRVGDPISGAEYTIVYLSGMYDEDNVVAMTKFDMPEPDRVTAPRFKLFGTPSPSQSPVPKVHSEQLAIPLKPR